MENIQQILEDFLSSMPDLHSTDELLQLRQQILEYLETESALKQLVVNLCKVGATYPDSENELSVFAKAINRIIESEEYLSIEFEEGENTVELRQFLIKSQAAKLYDLNIDDEFVVHNDDVVDESFVIKSFTIAGFPESNEIVQGSTFKLYTSVMPQTSVIKQTVIEIDSDKVIYYDSINELLFPHIGTFEIKVILLDILDVKHEQSITIEVIENENFKNPIVVDQKNRLMLPGQSIFANVNTIPESSIRNLNWVSDNPTVVQISGLGSLTAMGLGTANVTVSNSENFSESFQIQVVPKTSSFNLYYHSLQLSKDDTNQLAIHSNFDNDETEFFWSSTDSSVATVSTEGLITAIDNGECFILCRNETFGSSSLLVEVRR